MYNFDYDLNEILLRAANSQVLPVSKIGRPENEVRFIRPIDTDGYSIIGLDLTLDTRGNIRLIEANGSNMGATSFGDPNGDLLRARHMAMAIRNRIESLDRGVILLSYAPGTVLIHEHGVRAKLIALEICRLRQTTLEDATGVPSAGITVVFDSIVNIAQHVEQRDDCLFYKGVLVVAAANPNLLPELVRRGVIQRNGGDYAVDYSIWIDGPLLPLVHDKGAQQDVSRGTGIEPQLHMDCYCLNECRNAISMLHSRGLSAVVKMNAGSGGSGIKFCSPTTTQIHTHMCYAEFNDIIEAIAALDADVITIETSRSDMELLSAFVDFEYPNEIGPGVYDIHSPNTPSIPQMERLMEKAAECIPPERLWVNPDCGLKTRGWAEVDIAITNMVTAARNLRERRTRITA